MVRELAQSVVDRGFRRAALVTHPVISHEWSKDRGCLRQIFCDTGIPLTSNDLIFGILLYFIMKITSCIKIDNYISQVRYFLQITFTEC